MPKAKYIPKLRSGRRVGGSRTRSAQKKLDIESKKEEEVEVKKSFYTPSVAAKERKRKEAENRARRRQKIIREKKLNAPKKSYIDCHGKHGDVNLGTPKPNSWWGTQISKKMSKPMAVPRPRQFLRCRCIPPCRPWPNFGPLFVYPGEEIKEKNYDEYEIVKYSDPFAEQIDEVTDKPRDELQKDTSNNNSTTELAKIKKNTKLAPLPVAIQSRAERLKKEMDAVQMAERFIHESRLGNEYGVMQLIRQNVNIDWQGRDGKNALMTAALLGHLGTVQILVKSGADLDLVRFS